MKLVYITNARIPTEKAHGLQIMKMCEAFASLRIPVELVVPRRVNTIKQGPFEYYGVKRIFKIKKVFCVDLFWLRILPARISFHIQSFSFSVLVLVRALLKYQRKSDIFYSRDYITLLSLCFFSFWPVAEIHDYRSEKPRWFMRFILSRARKIIVNSEGTKEFLLEHYPSVSKKLLVAPNGVDVKFFDIKELREEARERLNIPKEQTIIGYVGRLETIGKEKGASFLLRAFGMLSESRKDCMLYIIGGPGELIEKYKASFEKWGISSGKIVFAGQVEYVKIPLYLKAIDVVVIPSPMESKYAATTSPIKLFEFLAAGKVIAAADTPSFRNYLNENNALFFRSGDHKDLSDKLNYLTENKNLAEKISQQAFCDAKNYSWLSRAEKIIEFIK